MSKKVYKLGPDVYMFVLEKPTCIKCGHEFTEEEIAKGEMGKVKKGPGKGRPMLTLICPKCRQKNIILKAKKS